MRHLFILIFISILLSQCTAYKSPSPYKSPKTVTVPNQYIDHIEDGEIVVDYGYNYMVTSNSIGAIIKRTFYPERNIAIEYCEYSDKQMQTKEGVYKSWSEHDGSKTEEGQYYNNMKEGTWKSHSKNETNTGDYLNNKKEGKWVSIDTLDVRTEYFYINGKKEGRFTSYNQYDKIIKTGEYVNGRLIGEATKDMKEMPYLKEFEAVTNKEERITQSQGKMLQQLYRNLKYPAKARENNIQGIAIVRFTIKEDGSVENIRIVKGICDPIADACRDVIPFLGPWNPAKENGIAVDMDYTLPIRFKLEG